MPPRIPFIICLNNSEMFSDPVTGEKFFGRGEILGLLEKRVSALSRGYRQNLAILGPEMIGKSSVVCEFVARSGHHQRDIILLYLRIENREWRSFVRKFVGTFLFGALRNLGNSVSEDIEVLFKLAERALPKTKGLAEKIMNSLSDAHPKESLSMLFDLPLTLKEDTGRSPVVILDEFHLLGALGIEDVFSIMGKKIMVQKDTMFIVTSSSLKVARDILREKLTLLFGNFETVELSPFDNRTALGFIEERLTSFKLDEMKKKFLLSFTGGAPFYLNVAASRLNESHDFTAMFEELLFDSTGVLNRYFASLTDRYRGTLAFDIFMQLAEHNNRIDDIAKKIKRPVYVVHKEIDRLIFDDIISKNGLFLKFNDRALGFWMSMVCLERERSLVADIQERRRQFREGLDKIMSNFYDSLNKNLPTRLAELFSSFKGDVVKLNERRYRLPHFEEVALAEAGNWGRCLVAREGDRRWICCIKEYDVGEEEMAMLVSQPNRTTEKVHKRLLILLGALEENAKLLAKQEKIWVWDAATLNLLLELYNLHPVIA